MATSLASRAVRTVQSQAVAAAESRLVRRDLRRGLELGMRLGAEDIFDSIGLKIGVEEWM